MADAIQNLYDTISGDYDVGTFDIFRQKLTDPAKRKLLYDTISSDYDVGTFENFDSVVASNLSFSPTGNESEALSPEIGTQGRVGSDIAYNSPNLQQLHEQEIQGITQQAISESTVAPINIPEPEAKPPVPKYPAGEVKADRTPVGSRLQEQYGVEPKPTSIYSKTLDPLSQRIVEGITPRIKEMKVLGFMAERAIKEFAKTQITPEAKKEINDVANNAVSQLVEFGVMPIVTAEVLNQAIEEKDPMVVARFVGDIAEWFGDIAEATMLLIDPTVKMAIDNGNEDLAKAREKAVEDIKERPLDPIVAMMMVGGVMKTGAKAKAKVDKFAKDLDPGVSSKPPKAPVSTAESIAKYDKAIETSQANRKKLLEQPLQEIYKELDSVQKEIKAEKKVKPAEVTVEATETVGKESSPQLKAAQKSSQELAKIEKEIKGDLAEERSIKGLSEKAKADQALKVRELEKTLDAVQKERQYVNDIINKYKTTKEAPVSKPDKIEVGPKPDKAKLKELESKQEGIEFKRDREYDKLAGERTKAKLSINDTKFAETPPKGPKEIAKQLDDLKKSNKVIIGAADRNELIKRAKGDAPENIQDIRPPLPSVIDEATITVEGMYNRSDQAWKNVNKPSIKKLRKSLSEGLVDVAGQIKNKMLKEFGDEGKRAVIEHDLVAGATPRGRLLSREATKLIYKGLNSRLHKALDRYIISRRLAEIDRIKGEGVVPGPEGILGSVHQKYLNNLSPELKAILEPLAKEYSKTMEAQLKRLLDEGIINDDLYNMMKNSDYAKKEYIQFIEGPDVTYDFGSGPISVSSNGLQKLGPGSVNYLRTDTQLLMEHVITSVENRVARNNANKALHEIATKYPDNGVIELWPNDKRVPGGKTRVNVMIDGKEKAMAMPNEWAKEWIIRDPMINRQLVTAISWGLGVKPLKAMATGYNPGFVLRNIPRDAQHIWLSTGEYSKAMPIAALQMGKDAGKVAWDSIRRKGRYRDYIMEGGGMEFLSSQGTFNNAIGQYLGYLNETSEIVMRLALRERALKNGVSPVEATWIARNYLDFSQGGRFAKAADAAFPYLNAGIQGTRGVARAAKQDPVTFGIKVAQIGGLATGLYLANRLVNPEAQKNIPSRVSVNNWVLTTPWSFQDKEGNDRHVYIKIAKDQGQRVFATFFEALMQKHYEGKYPTQSMFDAMKEFWPITPTTNLPPLVSAILGYKGNYDFWRNEKIWKDQRNIKPELEKYPTTHPGYVAAGEMLHMSPVRLERAMSKVVTNGNIYTSLVGAGLRPFFDEMAPDQRRSSVQEMMGHLPLAKRIIGITPPPNTDELEQDLQDITSVQVDNNQKFDAQFTRYKQGGVTVKDLGKWIQDNVTHPDEKERIVKRLKRSLAIKDLPNRKYWLKLADEPAESRAWRFYTDWSKKSKEEQKEYMKTAGMVPDLISDPFKQWLNYYMKEGVRIDID